MTGAVAWLLGLITARLSGHFLALVSVAWGMSFFSLFGTLPLLHGFNGIGDIPPLRLGPLSAENPRVNLGVIWAVTVARDGGVGQFARQPRGARDPHAERGAVDGGERGDHTVRLSRAVFVIAALYAGISGFLFAHFQRFITPTPFNLGASIDYLFMVIIGGSESLWGAPLGAALVVVLRDQFNDWIPRLTGRAGDFEALVFSLVVIVLLQRAPAGLLPLLARWWCRAEGRGRSQGRKLTGGRQRRRQRPLSIRVARPRPRRRHDDLTGNGRSAPEVASPGTNCSRWRRSRRNFEGSRRYGTSISRSTPVRSSR